LLLQHQNGIFSPSRVKEKTVKKTLALLVSIMATSLLGGCFAVKTPLYPDVGVKVNLTSPIMCGFVGKEATRMHWKETREGSNYRYEFQEAPLGDDWIYRFHPLDNRGAYAMTFDSKGGKTPGGEEKWLFHAVAVARITSTSLDVIVPTKEKQAELVMKNGLAFTDSSKAHDGYLTGQDEYLHRFLRDIAHAKDGIDVMYSCRTSSSISSRSP
jgi:hypothetical protein